MDKIQQVIPTDAVALELARSAVLAPATAESLEHLIAYLLRRVHPVLARDLATAWAHNLTFEDQVAAVDRAAATEYWRRGGRPASLLKLGGGVIRQDGVELREPSA